VIPELLNGTSHGFPKRVNNFFAFAQYLGSPIGVAFQRNNRRFILGITQFSAPTRLFFKQTFNAFAQHTMYITHMKDER
jgi:hypothetical protein